jgi:Flp pilus assembly protein TadD
MPKATAFAPSLIALLLGCSALISPAQAGWFDSDSKPAAPVVKKDDKPQPLPAVTLDDSIRQAQMLRLGGNYQEAVSHLSQLMLVAANDPRIISEYGKTLVSMGRADEAEKFLTRAQQLQPDDWTVYSALGVAYDEIGNQKAAQVNYERALSLRPGEASVLNNYALSRMLAKDPAMARKLADRAETANAAAKDEKIDRNIAMIRSMAPESHASVAISTPAPGTIVPPVTAPVVHAAVATAAPPPVKPADAVSPVAQAASPVAKPVVAAQPVSKPSQPVSQAPRAVVMQPMPVDPLAGPVTPKANTASREPRSLQPAVQAASLPPVNVAAKPIEPAKPAAAAPKPEALAQAKPVPGKDQQAKTEPAKPRSPADIVAQAKAASTVAQAKPAAAVAQAKPAATVAQAKPAATVAQAKPAAAVAQANPAASKDQLAKAEPVKPAVPAVKVSLPLKAADVKPNGAQPAPKVMPAAPVKAADAKPQDGKANAASKDAIPGLRMSANAY